VCLYRYILRNTRPGSKPAFVKTEECFKLVWAVADFYKKRSGPLPRLRFPVDRAKPRAGHAREAGCMLKIILIDPTRQLISETRIPPNNRALSQLIGCKNPCLVWISDRARVAFSKDPPTDDAFFCLPGSPKLFGKGVIFGCKEMTLFAMSPCRPPKLAAWFGGAAPGQSPQWRADGTSRLGGGGMSAA